MRNKAKSLGNVAGAFVVFICCSESYFFASGIHIASQPFGGLQTIPGKYLTRKIGFLTYSSGALLVEGSTTISKVGACKKAFAIKTSTGIAIYPEDDIALPCCKMLSQITGGEFGVYVAKSGCCTKGQIKAFAKYKIVIVSGS